MAPMKMDDPRWAKTGQIVFVAMIGLWIGNFFGGEVSYSTLSWVTFALVTATMIACLFLLLRDLWKPNA